MMGCDGIVHEEQSPPWRRRLFASVPFIWPRPPEANTRNEPEARSIATEFVELMVSDSWRRGAGLAVPPESDEGLLSELGDFHRFLDEHEIYVDGPPVYTIEAGIGNQPAFVFPASGISSPGSGPSHPEDWSIEVGLLETPLGWRVLTWGYWISRSETHTSLENSTRSLAPS